MPWVGALAPSDLDNLEEREDLSGSEDEEPNVVEMDDD